MNEIEQVLRNTLGFRKLRSKDSLLADSFLEGVYSYAEYIQEPGQPIKLVDSTGFSLESVRDVLGESRRRGIGVEAWNAESLFSPKNQDLRNMMGVLLRVPELRRNLEDVTGGKDPDGEKLSLIVKDWVNGLPVNYIAHKYFMEDGDDETTPVTTKALTNCAQNLFGRLIQTAAWGLGALLSITGGQLSEDEMRTSATCLHVFTTV